MPTMRAVDGGDSPRFTDIFLASGFSCSQAFSQPAPPPLTHTVSPLVEKHIAPLMHRFGFGVGSFKMQFVFCDNLGLSFLAAVSIVRLFRSSSVLVFKFLAGWFYLRLFKLSFRLSAKFWLTLACDYLARLWVNSLRHRSLLFAKSIFGQVRVSKSAHRLSTEILLGSGSLGRSKSGFL